VTVRKVIAIYKFPRRVPAAGIYSAISGNFHTAYANGDGQSNIKVTPTHSGVEAGRVAVPSEPVVLGVTNR
jgi:hypothetical protein